MQKLRLFFMKRCITHLKPHASFYIIQQELLLLASLDQLECQKKYGQKIIRFFPNAPLLFTKMALMTYNQYLPKPTHYLGNEFSIKISLSKSCTHKQYKSLFKKGNRIF